MVQLLFCVYLLDLTVRRIDFFKDSQIFATETLRQTMTEHNITPHLVLNLTDNILRAAEAHMLRELEVNAAFR